MQGETSSKEFRVFGPPGCGKTTYLARQIENAARVGMPKDVFVTSFTRAAAEELVGRNIPIPKQNIGTLHSHCFQALGHPKVAESSEGYKSWSEFCTQNNMRKFLLYRVGEDVLDADADVRNHVDAIGGTRPGSELMRDLQRLRGAMVPAEMWPNDVLAFKSAWNRWKSEAGFMDFTDLIEYGARFDHAPGKPTIGFVDEAQDLSALEMATVLRWTSTMERVITALDDEQCQPAGNLVLTTDGWLPIEELNPSEHKLTRTQHLGKGEFEVELLDGDCFRIEENLHYGDVIRITTSSGLVSTYTDTHFCCVLGIGNIKASMLQVGHSVPTIQLPACKGERNVAWEPIVSVEVLRPKYGIPVWGISTPTKYYVSNGIVTHNCLYTFKGARPDMILNRPIPEENIRVLAQSYRVPKHVHAMAVAWAKNRIKTRYPKEYRPKAGDEGRIVAATRQDIAGVESLMERIEERTSQGKTCMLLATCRHMLAPMVRHMRDTGVRFHNPYTPHREWNPAEDLDDSVGAFSRLAAFLRPVPVEGGNARMWDMRDVQLWVKDLQASKAGLRRGLQRQLSLTAQDLLPAGDVVVRRLFDPTSPEGMLALQALEIFGPGQLDDRGRPDLIRWLDWYESCLSPRGNAMKYAISVVRRSGIIPTDGAKPSIIIGTIHSVKGGEADCVFLSPDISPIGAAAMGRSQDAMDSMGRAFYVGMTRAKEELFLLSHMKGSPKADFRPILDSCGAPYFIEAR